MKNKKYTSKNISGENEMSGNILQNVIDATDGLIVFSLDKNYCYTSFSKSHKDTMKFIWGKEIELGQNMLDYILREDDRNKAKQNFDRVIKGESFVIDEEYGNEEHRTFWENHYSPIFDDSGNVTGVSVFVINITRRKNLELELAEKERLFRTTFYSIGDAVITTDRNGNVVLMNPLAEKFTGWTEEEAAGKKLTEVFNIISSITREPVKNPVEDVIKKGIIVGLANHTVLVSKTGKEYQIADSAAPITTIDGVITGVVLVFRDVTEKYRIENELRAKTELNEAILNAMPDLLFVINDKYEFVFYSTPHDNKDLLYEKPESFLGKSVFNILPEKIAAETKKKIDFVLQTKNNAKFNYDLEIEGETRYFTARLIYKGKNEVLTIVTDITEIELAESKFRSIFDDTPSPMHLVNNNFEILLTNKTLLNLKGLKQEDILGQKCYKVYKGNDNICPDCPAEKVIKTKTTRFDILTTKDAKGNVHVLKSITFPIREKNGQIVEIVRSTIDITEQHNVEKELKYTTENYQILSDLSPIGIVVHRKGKFVYVNKAALNLFGAASKEELFSRSFRSFIHPDFIQYHLSKAHELTTKRKVINFAELKIIDMNGKMIDIEGRGSQIMYNGEPAILTLLEDVSERKVAERKVRAIFDVTPYPMHLVNNNFEILLTNKHLLDLKGLKQEDIVGKKCYEIYQNRSEICENCAIKKVIETKSTQSVFASLKDAKGNMRYFNTVAFPLREENGKVVEIVESTIDITEQKVAEKMIKENEERLSTLINSTPDIICFKDGEGKWLVANDADLELFQLKGVDYVGKTDTELAEYTAPLYRESFLTCMETDEIAWRKKDISIAEEIIPTVSGDEKIYEVIKVPLFNEDGSRKGIVVLGRDITERKHAEKELEQSRADFQRIIETWLGGIVIHSGEEVLYVNKAALSILVASSKEEIMKNPVSSYIHPDFIEDTREKIIFMEKTGNHVGPEIQKFIRLDGQEIWVRNTGSRIVFNGKPAIIIFFEDITEHIKAEEKIKENEEIFRTLAETTTAAIFVFDKEKFLYVNKTTEQLTGYSAEELLNMNFWSVVHPDFRELVKKRGQMRTEGKRVPENYEFKIVNKSGKGIWISFSASKVLWKGKKAALGSAIDITKRKNIELNLIKSEHKYKLISKLTSDYIFESEIDENGKITTIWASKSFEQITGYSLSELRERGDWSSIVHPNDYWIEKESVKNIINNRVGISEVRIIRKDGNTIWVRSKGEPIWSEKEKRVVGIVGAVSDITERKKMIEDLIEARQKAEASEKVKTEFLAQMSHEIRSPLNVVLNFISLIKMELGDNINEDIQMAFSSIDSSSRRLIRTIDLILNMTELQTGTYESVKEETNIVEQTNNVISEYANAAEVKKLKFEFINEIGERKIVTDSYAFLQTVVNLIDNAIKYTKEGGIRVKLSENASKDVVIEVSDTGIGISKEYLPQIFSAFSQEEQGYTRKFEGNGLGMALVGKYINYMKGRITVESEKGKGTTFTLTIPDLSGK